MSVAQAPVSDPREAFQEALGVIRQRIWLERAGLVVTRGLTLGFLLTLVVAVAAWFTKIPVPPLYYVVPLLIPLIIALFIGAFLYPSATSAARITDRRLDLAEQLGTAVEVAAEPTEDLVSQAHLAAATDSATWADQHWRGGPKLGRELALAAMLGFVAAGVLLLTGPEGRALLGPRAQLPLPVASPQPVVVPSPLAVAKPQASPQPSPAAKPQQQQQQGTGQGQGQGQGRTGAVQRAVDDIRRSRESGQMDAGEAARRLGQAEGELSREAQQSSTDKSALDRLGQAMDQIAAGHPAAQALQQGNYEQAAQEINSLGTDSDQLSAEAKAQLARALRDAANDSASSPELSQRERRAADALAGRDYDATKQAMGDLGDQVGLRGRNVIPQSELSRAWDQVNQERRAEGQPDSPGSTRQAPPPTPQPRNQPSNGQQGQGQQSQGQQGQQGQSNQPQPGNGNGSAPSQGGPPGDAQPPDAPAPRLDTEGKPVPVDVKPGQQPGNKNGDAAKDDNQPLDDVGSISSSSSGDPNQVTSAAPPELNSVPSARRDVVRSYFQSQSQAQSGQGSSPGGR
jgi:hypothetical protein